MASVSYKDKVQSQAFRAGVQVNTKDSLDWFRKQLRGMKNVSRQGLIKDPDVELAQRILPGRMYMYFYDPKHKKTLPYYDRFPLIIAVKPAKGGFFGLNVHYLPPMLRARLFDGLLDYKVGEGDFAAKMKITLGRLNSASKLRFYKPCYKQYLNKQISSKVVQVPAADWDFTLFLPSEQFKKASTATVWKDSKKMIS
jgi:hypothetical protein